MLHTVGEAAVHRTITAAARHRRLAAGEATNRVATPAGVPNHRARRAGAVEAVAGVGAAAAVAGVGAVVVSLKIDAGQLENPKPTEE